MPDELIKEYVRDDSNDYLLILKAIKEIPFQVGKNLLVDFLTGNFKNQSIKNNNLSELLSFDSFENYDKEEVKRLIDKLIDKRMIEVTSIESNPFMKTLRITDHGNNQLKKKKERSKIYDETIITKEDKKMFEELNSFLSRFNDYQKKAIISNKEKILCIAGAGSGKTLVLTKRIEFLIKYQAIDPNKILAITFTRKARQEMQDRLMKAGITTNVETFNSFSEKILQKYGNKIYGRQIKVMTYGNKVMGIMSALEKNSLKLNEAIDKYFSENQKRNKSQEQLTNIFMNDCYYILDYFKSKNQELYDFSKVADAKDVLTAKMIYNICRSLIEYMQIHGLRSYTDQILDTLNFFKCHKEYIPFYEHILVDEFQDVNVSQIELIENLYKKNLFCVGDPRQSIFGWRGSDIKFILTFPEKYSGSEVISLDMNYRSDSSIVDLMNLAIKDMDLPDLKSVIKSSKEITLKSFGSEADEFSYILELIKSSGIENENIFILSRTNRQINEFSNILKQNNIYHLVKTDELNSSISAKKGQITLATIHSIKGLEAKMVIILGANEQNFPCKASDHPIIEIIKVEDYDKESEEKRLFYVAISRAKHRLHITYTGKKPTYFINEEMMKIFDIME